MNLKEMLGIILREVKIKYGNKKAFCAANDIDYSTFTTTLDQVLRNGKDVQVGTLIKFLNGVNFELTIKEIS